MSNRLGWGLAEAVGGSLILPWSFYDWSLISSSCQWGLLKVYWFQPQTTQEDCQPLSLKALFRTSQKVFPNTSWDGTMQQTQLPASRSNRSFQAFSRKSNTLWDGTNNYHSCTGDHFTAAATTTPAPAATFLQKQLPVLHQQLPALHRRPSCSSVYQICTSSC